MAEERIAGFEDEVNAIGVVVIKGGAAYTVTHEGITRTLKEWSEATGIGIATLFHRLILRNWSPSQAFGSPVKERKYHGMTETPEFKSWRGMLERCFRKNNKAYPRYGGRGITVCDRWKESFLSFLEDVGRRPGPSYSLDRTNNDGDYEPGNCRWATKREQARNRRSCRRLSGFGRVQSLVEWSEEFGINQNTVKSRLARGWTLEESLTVPVGSGTRWT